MPKNPLLAPKNPLFNGYFALLGVVFHDPKGFYLGVAIIMMLWLHLFMNESDMGNYVDFSFSNGQSLAYFLTRLCSPVSFFLILSGYGFAHLYSNNHLSPRTQLPRLLKLYVHYWWIMLIFVSIGAYVRPDLYPGTIKDVVLNLSSWSHSYNSVTWFLLPYTLISISALYIMRIVEKFGLKLAVAVTFILYITLIPQHFFL